MLKGVNGESYNVGNNQMQSISSIVKLFLNISKLKVKVMFKKSKDANYTKDNPQSRCPDIFKIGKTLNWKPKTSVKEGIRKTLTYYKILN
jgi:dTDP-D-glucose 4,6-dehydratase